VPPPPPPAPAPAPAPALVRGSTVDDALGGGGVLRKLLCDWATAPTWYAHDRCWYGDDPAPAERRRTRDVRLDFESRTLQWSAAVQSDVT